MTVSRPTTISPTARGRPAATAVWGALAIVYVVWGSTYLAIRVVVEADVPPLLAMGTRFVAAAVLLGVLHAVRHGGSTLRVGPRSLAGCAVMGGLLLVGGNGLVAVGEQTVPSGLTALLLATTPLWLVVLRLVTGEHPRAATMAGVLVGFGGVMLLALRGGGISGVQAWGVVVVVVASLSWAIGSFLSPRLGLPDDAVVATVWEMLTGGVTLVTVGLARGEGARFHPGSASAGAWVAWVYLVIVGSMVAFSAYVWLLAHAPISLVATYAYVNPVVAVLLGWAVLSEPVTAVVLGGGALVVVGVALVVSAERPRRPEPPGTSPEVHAA